MTSSFDTPYMEISRKLGAVLTKEQADKGLEIFQEATKEVEREV